MVAQYLSPFHLEIMEHLEKDVKKRCISGEINENAPQVQSFFQQLQGTQEKVSLSEIIHNYHYLFQTAKIVHLEKFLIKAFTFSEFISHGLSRYYPKIYRGLPRLYRKDFPLQSRIISPFSHLPSLKMCALTKALYSLYAKVKVKGVVTIFSDLEKSSLDIYYMLKARVPSVTFRHIVAGKTLEDEQKDLLLSSDLILQLGAFESDLTKVIKDRRIKIEKIGGYGDLLRYHPKSNSHCLGLHFLEKGILLRKPCFANFSELTKESLRDLRNLKNRFFLGCLSTPLGGSIYLHSLLKSLEDDTKGIDICTLDIGWFLALAEKKFKENKPILKKGLKVKCIELHSGGKVYTLPISSRGKKVRLLHVDHLTQSDFRILLSLSEDWVAVNSDWTFSEAVSQNKQYFYDGPNRSLVKDLAAISENRIEPFEKTLTCIRGINQNSLKNREQELSDWVDESYFQEVEEGENFALEMGVCLKDPETALGYQALNKILFDEFSANAFICYAVQRALFHLAHPEIEQIEHQNVQSFISKKLRFTQLVSAVKKGLNLF